jgi:hypothetical protein
MSLPAVGVVGANPGLDGQVHVFSTAEGSPSSPVVEGAGADPLNSTFKQLLDALQSVNGEQAALDGIARRVEGEGAQIAPGEMVMLSMRCDEFLFHCELTANAANRSSDGLQQLFREQN